MASMFIPFNEAGDRINIDHLRKVEHISTKGQDGSDIHTLLLTFNSGDAGGGQGENPEPPKNIEILFGDQAARFELALNYLYEHGFGPEYFDILERQFMERMKAEQAIAKTGPVGPPTPTTFDTPKNSENVADQAVKAARKKPPASSKAKLN